MPRFVVKMPPGECQFDYFKVEAADEAAAIAAVEQAVAEAEEAGVFDDDVEPGTLLPGSAVTYDGYKFTAPADPVKAWVDELPDVPR
jgi:hypothetical protein